MGSEMCIRDSLLCDPKIKAFRFLHFVFDNLNLSPFFGIPPKIQYASFKFFNIFSEEAKLVDFESLIIVRFLFSNIICCLKSRP